MNVWFFVLFLSVATEPTWSCHLLHWGKEELSVSHRFNLHVFRFPFDLLCVRELILDLVFLFLPRDQLQVYAILLRACTLTILDEEHKILDSETIFKFADDFFCRRKHLKSLQLSQLAELCDLTNWADKDMSISHGPWVYHCEHIPACDEHILWLNLLSRKEEWSIEFAVQASCARLHSLNGERVANFLSDSRFTFELFVFVHRFHLGPTSSLLLGWKVRKHR